MTRTGHVEAVWLERRGTNLAAAAAEGDQQLAVQFSTDFDEGGGDLQHVPTGDVYSYTSADANAETITLTDPLPAGVAWDEGDALRVYPPSDDVLAHVRLEDDTDAEPIVARVSQPLRAMLPEGSREAGAGEMVELDQGPEWVVVDMLGDKPAYMFAGVDGGTVDIGFDGSETTRMRIENGDQTSSIILRTNDDTAVIDMLGANSIMEWIDSDGELVAWKAISRSNAGEWWLYEFVNGSSMYQIHVKDRWFLSHDSTGGVAFDETGWWKKFYWGGTSYVDDFAIEEWTSLALQNGWGGVTGDFGLKYKVTPHGDVRVVGSIQGGTADPGTVVTNLPAAYRPKWQYRGPLYGNNPTTGNPRCLVEPSGDIRIYGVDGGTVAFDLSIPLDWP